MTVPNLVIMGAARAGSTFLADQLAQHPAIRLSTPKETHFFALGEAPFNSDGPGDMETLGARRCVAVEDFARALGTGPEPVVLEASVSTLLHPDRSIPRLREHASADARFIVILRDPIERAASAYTYFTNRGFESSASFADGLALEDERRFAGWQHMWQYRGGSSYSSLLEPFVEAFGDRVIGVSHRALVDDTQATLDRLLSFVPALRWEGEPFVFETDRHLNASGTPRSDVAQRLINGSAGIEPIRRVVKSLIPLHLRDRIRRINLEAGTAMSEELRAELEDEFAAETALVEHLDERMVAPIHHLVGSMGADVVQVG